MSEKPASRLRSLPPTLARLPPLTSLRAFVATGRHLNFTRAADELHVTSAAIGQQIRLLEDYVGEPLFIRNRGDLELTESGRRLMPGLTDAFNRLLDTLAELHAEDDGAPIRVSVAPSFASKWLVPRLAKLRERAPELEVLIDASTRLADLNDDDVDCAIRYGAGAYPGLAVDRLFSEAVIPVCSPDLAARHDLHRGPQVLAGVTLLHEDGPERDASCPTWASWLHANGGGFGAREAGPRFSQSSLVIDAALAGQGIGLAKLRLIGADLASGRLVAPFGRPQPVNFSYYFAAAPQKVRLMRVERFRDWLLSEAALAGEPADRLPEQNLASDATLAIAAE